MRYRRPWFPPRCSIIGDDLPAEPVGKRFGPDADDDVGRGARW
jgi:hypothetical protein